MSSTDILTYPPVKNKLYNKPCLFALMSILAQSLFALVSGHLVALLLLSVWHDFEIFIMF